MSFLEERAINMMKYLLDHGIDPYIALDIVISKYEHLKGYNKRIKKMLMKEFKEYFEEN